MKSIYVWGIALYEIFFSKYKLETSDTYLLQNSQHRHKFSKKPVSKFRKSF